MTITVNPANYLYLLDRARKMSGAVKPRILDYGCGRGQFVELARSKGADMVGADTYSGYYGDWLQEAGAIKEFLHPIENGRIPFADESFDIVVSNQVFEHIADYRQAVSEIARVLKRGGVFFSLFPVRETWFEPHAGLYFVHYLGFCKRLQHMYLRAARALGFGFWKGGKTQKQWAMEMLDTVRDVCFYHRENKIKNDWESVFGDRPQFHHADYLLYRLKAPLARFLGRPFLWFVSRTRAGTAISVVKQ